MAVVQIQKPADTNLADWFAELRVWLDNNDCSPTLFTEAGRAMNREFFNISFADDVHARLFAAAFAKYGSSVRRVISGEAGEVEGGVDLTAAHTGSRRTGKSP